MPNINNLNSKQVLNFLLKNWFEIHHQKWSHIQLKKWSLRVTIPNHWNKILNIRTVYSILRQSWFIREDFENWI